MKTPRSRTSRRRAGAHLQCTRAKRRLSLCWPNSFASSPKAVDGRPSEQEQGAERRSTAFQCSTDSLRPLRPSGHRGPRRCRSGARRAAISDESRLFGAPATERPWGERRTYGGRFVITRASRRSPQSRQGLLADDDTISRLMLLPGWRAGATGDRRGADGEAARRSRTTRKFASLCSTGDAEADGPTSCERSAPARQRITSMRARDRARQARRSDCRTRSGSRRLFDKPYHALELECGFGPAGA